MADVLRQFTGDPGLQQPDKVIRQCWTTDPYTLGSGAYPSVTTSDDDFENLFRPLPSESDPRLLFAGEATHSQYWGQVSLYQGSSSQMTSLIYHFFHASQKRIFRLFYLERDSKFVYCKDESGCFHRTLCT